MAKIKLPLFEVKPVQEPTEAENLELRNAFWLKRLVDNYASSWYFRIHIKPKGNDVVRKHLKDKIEHEYQQSLLALEAYMNPKVVDLSKPRFELCFGDTVQGIETFVVYDNELKQRTNHRVLDRESGNEIVAMLTKLHAL